MTDEPNDSSGSPSLPIDARHLSLRLTPCVTLWAIAFVGGIIGPTLVKHHPVLLLTMNATNRHLLLAVGAGISPTWFFVIGFIRLVIPDPFFYLLGRDYGHRGVAWIEVQTQGQTGYLGWVQRWFDKASDVLLVVMPNTYVCMLAGMDRIRPRRMAPLDAVGTVGRLVLFWFAAKHWERQLRDFVDFIQRYQWWLVIGLFGVSILQSVLRQSRTRRASQAPPPSTASELGEATDGPDHPPTTDQH